MEATGSPEMLAFVYQTTWCQVPQDWNLDTVVRNSHVIYINNPRTLELKIEYQSENQRK
jgi:hypothetical protein